MSRRKWSKTEKTMNKRRVREQIKRRERKRGRE